MKKKVMLSAAFLISLLPMFLNQYGGMRGVQEISGLINLLNPIGIVSVILFFVGVWALWEKPSIGKIFGGIGVSGIVVSEIYQFFTWHILTITGRFSLQSSFRFAFPEFYFGFIISIAMIILYFRLNKTE